MIVKNLSQANVDLILGYIKKSLNQSEIIDDINLQTTSCFSSVKIDNLLKELTTKLKDYSDNLFNSLTALTVQIATEQPTLENSEKNIIYLYLTDAVNHVYMQYLKISDTELITLGETTIDLTDYYTKTEIDNTFATKTQVKTLEDDSHKHLNKDILDKLSVNDEDKLLYDGNKIGNDVVATKDTLGIINKDKFEIMKDDSVFINVGRGNIINEKDLIKYMNKFRGVALDVFENEPLDKNSELWECDNIIITPHNSWASDKNEERTFNMIYDNLKKYIENKPLKNTVDILKGY